MASIRMNPYYAGRTSFNVVKNLQHGHSWGIFKGVLVAMAIVGVGVFTLAAPALNPASERAEQVAAEPDSIAPIEE